MADPDKLEIKGLGLSVQNIRRSIALLRSEIAGLNSDSWDLQKTVVELREQINKTHDDLKFEAENLGNSEPESVAKPEPEPAPIPAAAKFVVAPEPLSVEDKIKLYRTTDHGAVHDKLERRS